MSILVNQFTYPFLLAAEKRLAPVRPRRALLAAGRWMTSRQLGRLRIALGALEEGYWLSRTATEVPNLADRFALFEEALRRVHGTHPLYVEFGVYRGRTLRWWSQHLALPTARFVGFDSFEGLPHAWGSYAPTGWFAAGGLPQFDDARVSLVAGWFDRTLPCWEPPAHDQLIVTIDCDLYSSTTCALTWLERHLRARTLIYFDDLLDRDDELRALREWIDRFGPRIHPLAMARWGQHLLIEVP